MTSDAVNALPYLQKVFETIAYAKVSESAEQARENGFLVKEDVIVANDENLIGAAKKVALDMAELGYVPPRRDAKTIYAIGKKGKAAMHTAVENLRWGGFISDYDAYMAKKLAHILCGGDLSSPQWVTEDYILSLEREAFIDLVQQPKTQDRIAYMLKNAKPLRN
jgi:3-hydroxyacyl-CoA dehydrogenase